MNRPYVIINCAMSADGKIALPNRKQLRLSCDKDLERMYKLRNEFDAVLVGIGSILSDNPKLTVKEKYVKNPCQPIRIVIDSKCKTPTDSLVVNQITKTFIVTNKRCDKKFEKNVEIIECPTDLDGLIDLEIMLDILHKRGIKTLMIEGGGTVIWSFLKKDLVDDLHVYIAPIIIGGKKTPTMTDGPGIKSEDEIISLKIVAIKNLGNGILIHYKRL
jgi:2,5-diamino-6-(ribosylamino)-4(3H)-pyrimidinone 5'-phosphate reductase